jgi:hypothetical protein
VHPGGGSLRCPGRLVQVVLVAITIPVARWRTERDFASVAPARVKRSGVRVKPETLQVASEERTSDIKCDSCSWSLAQVMRHCKARKRK